MKTLKSALIILITLIGIAGCANRVTPLGGPKDVLPPEIVSIEPPQKSTNFSSSRIIITFNEYVQLKEIGKQLVISPLMSPPPDISVRKKSIWIELPDSLAPNTTYSINFGLSIADNNEGNPLSGFRYVFSTGPAIDSLKVSGTILNAETQKPEKDAIALLYKSSVADSAVLKSPPDFYARAADDGTFNIYNVHEGDYKLFALTDKNNNLIFDPKDEKVGFISAPFNLKDSVKYVLNVAGQPAYEQTVKSHSIEEPARLVTVFARPLENASYRFIGVLPEKVLVEYSAGKDSVSLYCQPPDVDSLRILWSENELPVDTVWYIRTRTKGKQSPVAKKVLTWNGYPMPTGTLKAESNPSIKWSAPINVFDSSLVTAFKDSLPFAANASFTDSLKTRMEFRGNWVSGIYRIVILPGAVTDIYGFKNDTIQMMFFVPGERTVGSISFKLKSIEGGNYILQVVNDKDEIVRERITNGNSSGTFEQMDPGIFRLRIVRDENRNGRWDSGNFRKGVQPEEIEYNRETITVRANWDVEVEWNR